MQACVHVSMYTCVHIIQSMVHMDMQVQYMYMYISMLFMCINAYMYMRYKWLQNYTYDCFANFMVKVWLIHQRHCFFLCSWHKPVVHLSPEESKSGKHNIYRFRHLNKQQWCCCSFGKDRLQPTLHPIRTGDLLSLRSASQAAQGFMQTAEKYILIYIYFLRNKRVLQSYKAIK